MLHISLGWLEGIEVSECFSEIMNALNLKKFPRRRTEVLSLEPKKKRKRDGTGESELIK